jgi:hypothetical protein
VHDLRPGKLPESKLAGGAGRPGDTLRFASVTVGDGEALCRDAERLMTEMVTRLEPVPGRSAIDLGSLYDSNLISGVVSGLDF